MDMSEMLARAKESERNSRTLFDARVKRLEREFGTTYSPVEIRRMWDGWEWARLTYSKDIR